MLVMDGFGLYTEASVTITVVDANESPTVGFNYSFIPPVLDNIRYVDEGMPRYSVIGLPIPSRETDVGQSLYYDVLADAQV